jgi:hypothetical protein
MDISTNTYLKKSGTQAVVASNEVIGFLGSQKEFDTADCDYIIPFSTPPCDLRIKGENDPHWD